MLLVSTLVDDNQGNDPVTVRLCKELESYSSTIKIHSSKFKDLNLSSYTRDTLALNLADTLATLYDKTKEYKSWSPSNPYRKILRDPEISRYWKKLSKRTKKALYVVHKSHSAKNKVDIFTRLTDLLHILAALQAFLTKK